MDICALNTRIIEHCLETTQASRDFMQQQPDEVCVPWARYTGVPLAPSPPSIARLSLSMLLCMPQELPPDYVKYPGKMDHTSLVIFVVGSADGRLKEGMPAMPASRALSM